MRHDRVTVTVGLESLQKTFTDVRMNIFTLLQIKVELEITNNIKNSTNKNNNNKINNNNNNNNNKNHLHHDLFNVPDYD